MSKIKINESVSIDLESLVDTRLLVQANSGGGKSWLLRRILEQSHGKVQQIIIDLEGEFHTLREKYDYILAGKDGDTPADPRSAGLLARKLLELNVSAIIDLYELDHFNRKRFVRLFLESMVNAPKNLWHPCLVVVDEAHVFCPEKGQSEASEAVIDLATRGRKRGYCAILATQRLSKLHKDAAAECNNKLIGRTGLDIDMKRASEELGFTSKEQYLSLRGLEAGEFFAFGPAISKEVIKVKVGDVQTTHPKVGSRILAQKPVPPTNLIKGVLSKLADLPQAAEEEAKTVDELKSQVAVLKRQVRTGTASVGAGASPDHTERLVKIALDKQSKEFEQKLSEKTRWLSADRNKLKMFIQEFVAKGKEFIEVSDKLVIEKKPVELEDFRAGPGAFAIRPATVHMRPLHGNEIMVDDPDKPLTGGALRMLQVLASRQPMQFTKAQLATQARLSSRSGTYGTYLSLLRSRQFIKEENGLIGISPEGLEYLGSENTLIPQSPEETVNMWKEVLKGGAKRMFEVLVEAYPGGYQKDQLAELADLIHTSGTFGTYMSQLRNNGLVEITGSEIKANPDLFI